MGDGNGWEEERKLVRFRLDSMADELKEMRRESVKNFDRIFNEISTIKVRSALYGGLGGSSLAAIAHFLTRTVSR